jgi:hypothetical protein
MADGYLNKVEMKDGQILLYHRTANSKRPIYHMRTLAAAAVTRVNHVLETASSPDFFSSLLRKRHPDFTSLSRRTTNTLMAGQSAGDSRAGQYS